MGLPKPIDVPTAEQIISDIGTGLAAREALELRGVHPLAFYQAVQTSLDLERKYHLAQSAKTELYVEEIISIADGFDDPAKARNRIEARKWYASKMIPSKYSDRLDINVTQKLDLTSALAEARERIPIRTVEPIEITGEVLPDEVKALLE